MSVAIATENALPGTYNFQQMQTTDPRGDTTVAGFARTPSVNVGGTIQFSVTGGATLIDIFRVGYYGGAGFRLVTTIANTPAAQPELTVIPNSNGATTATAWSVTSSWAVPADAVSGMYLAAVKSIAPQAPNYFYITFVVRDDAAVADIIYKTSDSTWGAAYNNYGTLANVNAGPNLYGANAGVGNIMTRSYQVSYHRPVITRGTVTQTYWWATELPLIRFLERNGFTVKYVTCVDLDKDPSLLLKGTVFLSSGHDEYWSENMRDGVETWRDLSAGRSIFMSGNEVFWKARYEYVGDEARLICYKDTMPGPTGVTRNPGEALDPVTWTGTWKDTRWPANRPEWLLTGTDFRMNGINDYPITVPQNPYGGLKVWGGSSLVDGDVTFLTGSLGFEADSARPTQPVDSVKMLAAYTRNIDGQRADDNGQTYSNNGNLTWGIVSQRYAGGGITVGFGTVQWSWTLDGTHDRGLTVPQLPAQQFTVNLLRGLGAEPATLMSGVSLVTKPALDDFGLDPAGPGTTANYVAVYHGDIPATVVYLGDNIIWP